MLYDEKRFDPARADPWSLESLVGWLELQPANESYSYCDGQRCLLARYLRWAGVADGPSYVTASAFDKMSADGTWISRPLPAGFNAVAQGDSFVVRHTYGAALTRALALLEKQQERRRLALSCA